MAKDFPGQPFETISRHCQLRVTLGDHQTQTGCFQTIGPVMQVEQGAAQYPTMGERRLEILGLAQPKFGAEAEISRHVEP